MRYPRLGIWLLVTAVLGSTSFAREQPAPTFDLLIRGGTIVDGTGNPWFLGDVGISGDRIVAIGRLGSSAAGRRTIDARGLVVAPGFIDIHSHSDMTLFEDGAAQSKIQPGGHDRDPG